MQASLALERALPCTAWAAACARGLSPAAPLLRHKANVSTPSYNAQRCVELLRRKQAGVATCLILEKQRHLAAQMNEKVTAPEGESGLCARHL